MGSWWLAVLLVIGAGCSGRGSAASRDSGSDDTSGGEGNGSLVDAPGDTPPEVDASPPIDAPTQIDAPPFDPCAQTAPLPPGDELRVIQHGGQSRTFHVHVPGTYNRAATPIVLNFHGWGGSAAQQAQMTRMNLKADTSGFIAIHPNGTGAMQAWNAGTCCPPNAAVNTDDVGFTAAILDEVSARICVNRRRVYATGFSNGAFMAYRLACELSNRIAAIAPVAGVLGVAACNPSRPVPVGHFHGMLDAYVPYDGSPSVVGATFSSVDATINVFGVRNGCSGAPLLFATSGDTECYRYANGCVGNAEVRICRSSAAEHSWPGADPNEMPGETTTQAVNATDSMWSFFQMFELP